jgi:hypothetical protein
MARNRNVRLSQTIVPFGVGAVYDFLGESFVGCDTTYWKSNGTRLDLRRLAEKHMVEHFKAAPVQAPSKGAFAPRAAGVPYLRFPRWLFCPKCRSMTHWSQGREKPGEEPVCQSCAKRPKLVPMRFVVVCANGHLDDVPWHIWAHSRATTQNQRQCQSKDLRFRAITGKGTGLKSLEVRCQSCDAARPLDGISKSGSLRGLGLRCTGRQPWEREFTQCDADPEVVQRGASNVYFATVDSAIDIPPDSSYSTYSSLSRRIAETAEFELLRSAPDGPFKVMLIEQCANTAGCAPEDVRQVLTQEVGAMLGGGAPVADLESLDAQEWKAFITPQADHDERDRFITRHVPFLRAEDKTDPPDAICLLDRLVGQVVLATRLREVRALVGFQRYEQSAGKTVRPSLNDGKVRWLPAIEVFGEGIFVRLDEAALAKWETGPTALAAASSLEARRKTNLLGARLKIGTPRYILLHTLSHLLIRQLAFQCGYSSSSLRERIYSRSPQDGDPMAGILIYTAAGDVEGTLGGLVRQGEPRRLAHTILSALERAAWCGTDPICRECTSQGFGGLNRAACHACALVSETSCDNANALLDRSLLIGSDADGVRGFFTDVLDAALQQSTAAGVAR